MNNFRFALFACVVLGLSYAPVEAEALTVEQGLVLMAQCLDIGQTLQELPKNITEGVSLTCCSCNQQTPIGHCAAALILDNHNEKLLALKRLLREQFVLTAVVLKQFFVTTANAIKMRCRRCQTGDQWS